MRKDCTAKCIWIVDGFNSNFTTLRRYSDKETFFAYIYRITGWSVTLSCKKKSTRFSFQTSSSLSTIIGIINFKVSSVSICNPRLQLSLPHCFAIQTPSFLEHLTFAWFFFPIQFTRMGFLFFSQPRVLLEFNNRDMRGDPIVESIISRHIR